MHALNHAAHAPLLPAGSSVNRTLGDAATIENVLETAIFKAGLMLESNFGAFSKIKWSRASRTDKGVHSLGTVRVASFTCALHPMHACASRSTPCTHLDPMHAPGSHACTPCRWWR